MREDFWGRKNKLIFSILVLVLLTFTLPIGYLLDSQKDGFLAIGDLPGFYALGKIAESAPTLTELYDFQKQQQLQNEAFPGMNGTVHLTVYPPYVALLLAPAAQFGAVPMQIGWTVLSVVAFLGGIRILSSTFNLNKEDTLFFMAITLCSIAPLVGIFGGQNSAFSFLLVALLVSALQNKRIFLVAISVVLLAYKPHFSLLAFLYSLYHTRSAKLLFSVASGYLVLYAITALYFGYLWPLEWLQIISQYSKINFALNFMNQSSIPGVLSGMNFEYVGLLVIVLCGSFFILNAHTLTEKQRLALLPIGICLLAPQLLFYDLLIGFTAIPIVLHRFSSLVCWKLLFFAVLAAVLFQLRAGTGLPVMALLPLFATFFIVKEYEQARSL